MPGEKLAFFTMGKLNSFFFLEFLSEKMFIIPKSNNKWHQKTQQFVNNIYSNTV